MVIPMAAKKKSPSNKGRNGTSLANARPAPTAPAVYTPFVDVSRMMEAMNRRFSDVFGFEPFSGFPTVDFQFPSLTQGVRPVYSDIIDKGDHFEVRSDLPGVRKEDINVSIHGNRVEISAQSSSEKSEDSNGATYRERSQGTYYRAFDLGDDLDSTKAGASFVDGVLTLTLPKKNPTPVEHRNVPVQ